MMLGCLVALAASLLRPAMDRANVTTIKSMIRRLPQVDLRQEFMYIVCDLKIA